MICPHEMLRLTSTGTVLLTSGWSNYNLSLSKNSGDSCSLENTTVNTELLCGGQCGHSVVIPTYGHYQPPTSGVRGVCLGAITEHGS